MTDLGRFEEDDYMPDSGLLVVRDTVGGHWADDTDDAHPCGTIVRTGDGWLYAGAGDGPCVVRIQAHPAEPSSEGEWDDLVEIPYRSTTGAVGLTTIMMGAGEEQVRLGAPGSYRVRVAHRALPVSGELPVDDDELEPTDLWQLDFWPVDVVEPPRWLRRMTAPVGQLTPGWSSLLPYDVNEVADIVRWSRGADGMSVEELRQWGLEHGRGEGWLDDPPLSDPRPGWPALSEISAQAGLAVPTARRAVLPLMVALGMLTFDGERYRRVDRPPLAQDVGFRTMWSGFSRRRRRSPSSPDSRPTWSRSRRGVAASRPWRSSRRGRSPTSPTYREHSSTPNAGSCSESTGTWTAGSASPRAASRSRRAARRSEVGGRRRVLHRGRCAAGGAAPAVEILVADPGRELTGVGS